MRVLYLSYDGLTDPLGRSQILPYLIGLSDKGHEIDIISFEKPAIYRENKYTIEKICREAKLGYYPLRYTKRPPVFSTLWDIRKMCRKAAELHSRKPYEIVHCRSYIAALVGRKMQKKGLKFLFDMRGFYADERVDGNIWPQKHFIFREVYKFFKRKEQEFLRSADYVISLTNSAKDIIISWGVMPEPQRLAVIPCCVDTDHFNPDRIGAEQVAAIRRKLEIDEQQLVLGYVGSTGTWYLTDEMLRYFQFVLDRYPNSCMVFLTYDDPEQIKKAAMNSGLSPASNIRILGVPREELPQYMAIFNWSIFFIKPVFSKKASSPTKQGELMSMAIPVVCNAGVGDSDKIINQYSAGISLNSTSDLELKAAVEELPKLLGLDREKIKLGAKQYFSLENGIAKLNQIYAELTQ